MSLSDDLLRHPNLVRIRRKLTQMISYLNANSAFLVDDAGVVFAACGHMEFRFPNPLPELSGRPSDEYILEALLGEDRKEKKSPFILFDVSPRAILVFGFDAHPTGRRRRVIRTQAKRDLKALKKLLEI